jgi:integrase/recombinase XerD
VTLGLTTHDKVANDFRQAVRAFLFERESRGLSPVTIEWYRERLGGFCRWVEAQSPQPTPQTTTTDILRCFLSAIAERGVSTATVNGTLRAVKALFSFLEAEEYLAFNPARRIPQRRGPDYLPRVLSEEELAQLLAQPNQKTLVGARDHCLMILLLDTGVRISEALGLRLHDIEWAENAVKVFGKGRKERRVSFGSVCRRALWRYLQRRGDIPGQEMVFVGIRGDALRYCHVAHRTRAYGRKAGLRQPVSPHVFRRTCATMLLRNGASPFHVQALLGHTTLDMTRRYCKIANQDLAALQRDHGVVDRLRLSRTLAPKRRV